MVRPGPTSAERALAARCHSGLDAVTLQEQFCDLLPSVVPVDATFSASTDPATLLFTSAVSRGIPRQESVRFLENELAGGDVNQFRTIARQRVPVDWLDHVTSGDREVSPRYRDIMAPLGLGDELRAVARSGGQAWGVLCLHREDGPRGFTVADAARVRRLADHLAEGLRFSFLLSGGPVTEGPDAPGVLLVDDEGAVSATSEAGERWLWELRYDEEPVPVAVRSVVAVLRARDSGSDVELQPKVRVQTRSGNWAVLHASRLVGSPGRTAVVVEAARPAELAPLILAAHSLTDREGQVAQLVMLGHSTRTVARSLRITDRTVEDHLKSIFTKVGVSSRSELTAQIFLRHYRPSSG